MCMYIFNSLNKLDNVNKLHSLKVGELVKNFSKFINLYNDDLYMGAIFHDIGKLFIPLSILSKPSELTDEEYAIIKTHPEHGLEFIQNTSYKNNEVVCNCIKYHHLKYNGENSYPNCNLKYDNIPMEARIVSICDSYDAMTSDRGYNKVISKEEALNELIKYKGIKYDPELVDKFVMYLNN